MRFVPVICIALLVPGVVLCQSRTAGQPGRRTLLPRDREIALARSAAPAPITDSATIYVLGEREYELAVHGTNGNACYVSRDWLASLEPHCFDAEGAATIMAMAMYRVGLLHQGRTVADAEREVNEGIGIGHFRLPRRPVMSYMMSYEQQLISDQGQAAGRWQPHIMIYYPYLTGADVGLRTDLPTMSMSDPGTPLSNIVVVVPGFVRLPGTAAASP